jgi:beta-catenin-like protein 1
LSAWRGLARCAFACDGGKFYEYHEARDSLSVVITPCQHENGDIAASMISLLSDLTDADEVIEGDASSSLNDLKTDLTTMLIKNGLIKVLLNALTSSLDESNSDEETAGVYNVLSIIENLVDLNPRELFVEMKDTDDLLGVLEWLTARVTQKRPRDGELDSNTQYASEILAVILQSAGPSVRNRFVDQLEGVDATLRALAPYRNSPPTTTEEAEFLENMFDVLCAVLMEDKAKRAFLDNEGVELMVLFLKGRTVSRTAALKSLDFATTRFAPAAGICIDKGLLSLLFSVFMGKLKVVGDDKKKIRKHIEANKEEEGVRCVSIMNNLFVGLADCTVEEAVSHNYRERLVAKFAEKDGEKCRRLIETLVVFAGRVASEEERIRLIFEGDGEDVKEEVLLAKMEAGLFTVQQCAMILAELWASGNFVLRKRILTILHEHELTLKYLDTTLREYVANLGGEEDRQQLDGKNGRIERVQLLIKTMVHEC